MFEQFVNTNWLNIVIFFEVNQSTDLITMGEVTKSTCPDFATCFGNWDMLMSLHLFSEV